MTTDCIFLRTIFTLKISTNYSGRKNHEQTNSPKSDCSLRISSANDLIMNLIFYFLKFHSDQQIRDSKFRNLTLKKFALVVIGLVILIDCYKLTQRKARKTVQEYFAKYVFFYHEQDIDIVT